MAKQQWEVAYDDWEKLLKDANATDLLGDPKAVWDEAWRQVVMLSTQIVDMAADEKTAEKIKTQLERKLMR
jgi:hypothetical protein